MVSTARRLAVDFHRRIVTLMGMDPERRHEIYVSVARSANLRDGAYWLEIVLSAGIATLGLILNSPAVIIGAMLISPLMGPILANGLALAAGDLVLSIRALTSLLISSLAAVLFATMLVVLLPFREMTAEIAARTQPNTLDLIIALFSGAVGSVAACKNIRGVATSIPGVAIAVALMPPLCVVGYGMGLILTIDRLQGAAVVRGGGLLFLTNLVAITFMAMVVFLIFRIDGGDVRDRVRESNGASDLIGRIPMPHALARIGSRPGRLIMVGFLIIFLIVPLSRSLNSMKREIVRRQSDNLLQQRTTKLWQQSFARSPSGEERSYIDAVSASESGKRVSIHMRIFTSKPYSREERVDFSRRLSAIIGRRPESIDFSLVEIPTSHEDVASRIQPEVTLPKTAPPLSGLMADLQARVTEAVSVIKLPAPATLIGYSLILTDDGRELQITYLSVRDIDEDGQSLLRDRYQQAVGDPLLTLTLRRVVNSVAVIWPGRQTALGDRDAAALRELAALANRYPAWSLAIAAPPEDRYSARRVESIRSRMIDDGVAASRISSSAASNSDRYLITLAPAPQTGQP